ncbi:hypothetical protein OG590_40510 (plasmid) [Streptomyces goshikiensis]|uniref:hypothetical protein n=1 Tax=Streptomyces goshikiensis TaxID=1942 RepID=UPI002F9157DB|nr:hypothetical protein OG590_40510 [Streptomyces goshikiensis]
MARKLNKKSKAVLHRLCLIVAAVFAVPVYVMVPLTGRGPIGAATLVAAALGYGMVRLIGMKAYAAATRPAPRTASK